MPFLTYQSQAEGNPVGRSVRGHAPLVWKAIKRTRGIAKRARVIRQTITRRVLATGPCPGLWRVYYASQVRSQSPPLKGRIRRYLGMGFNRGKSTEKLGKVFEEWTAAANKLYNEFIRTRDPGVLDGIEAPALRTFYRARADEHMMRVNPNDRTKSIMEVDPDLEVLPEVPLEKLTPDGLFLSGRPAAIFESKLRDPTYLEFKLEIAMYALVAEKVIGRDVDFGIVLHGRPPDDSLELKIKPVENSFAVRILENLDRFLRLTEIAFARRRLKIFYGSWKEFLKRPSGLPPPNKRRHCETCLYQTRCFQDGGEPIGA